jgi:hypothetical protein
MRLLHGHFGPDVLLAVVLSVGLALITAVIWIYWLWRLITD